MSIKRDIVLRVRIAFILTFLVAGMVIFRIVKVQYVEGDEWRSMGETLGIQAMNVKATRGNIYADDGSLLATSLPFYRLAIDPYLPSDGLYKNTIDSLSYLLSRYYNDLTPTQYKKKIEQVRHQAECLDENGDEVSGDAALVFQSPNLGAQRGAKNSMPSYEA